MKRSAQRLAACAAATFAVQGAVLGMTAQAAPAAAGAAALATPAPVPGTLDFQYAALQAASPAVAAAAVQAPAAPAPGSVGVARRVTDAAGAFEAYTRRAGGIEGGFKTGPAVLSAVDLGGGYQARQLEEGAIAYGALAAMQDPLFVDAVAAAAPTPQARRALAARLLEDPASVLRLQGSHETAARVAAIVGARGFGLVTAGEAVRKASYHVQSEAWSKAPIPHVEENLTRIKAQSAAPATLGDEDAHAMMAGLMGLRQSTMLSPVEAGFRPTPATAQALALAALAVMGEAGEERTEAVARLLTTDQGEDCLKLAKLNLYQCLAVAGPHYEDLFCLGRHGLADTGQCVMSTAGWSGPLAPPVLVRAAEPVAAPVALLAAPLEVAAAPPPPPPSVAVPMAVAALDGPERASAFAAAAELAPLPPAASPAPPPREEPQFLARADLPAYRAPVRPARLDRDEDEDDAGYARGPRVPRRDADDERAAQDGWGDAPYPPPSRPPAYAYARYESRDRYADDRYAPRVYGARQSDEGYRYGSDPGPGADRGDDGDAYGPPPNRSRAYDAGRNGGGASPYDDGR